MTDMSQLKQQYEHNLAKIENYDNCLRKIQKHNTIVDNIIEQHEKERDNIMDLLRQKESVHEVNVAALKAEIINKNG